MSSTEPLPTIDFEECPCTGGTLDRLVQPAILVVLAQGPMHGYLLAERIGTMSILGGHKPDVSGIYRFLKMMESKGMVTSAWDLSETGPAKKSYQITAAGRQCLEMWIKTLEGYRRDISELIEAARKVRPGN